MWPLKYEAKLATLDMQLQLAQQELNTTKECFIMMSTQANESKKESPKKDKQQDGQKGSKNESVTLSAVAAMIAQMQQTQTTQAPTMVQNQQTQPYVNYGFTGYRPGGPY